MIDSAAMGAAWLIRVALTAACAALVAGCGGDDGDEGTAREAAQDYVQARNDGDAGRVCELYSDQLIEKLGASDCQSFVKEQTAGVATSFTLVSVRERGDHATAILRASVAGEGGDGGRLRITLERQDGEWRITGLSSGAD